MVHFQALFTLILLVILAFRSSATATATNAHGGHGEEAKWRWQRKPWMNHGSFRGPRERLVNPTVEQPFQIPKLPV
ncbi:hypothetical protein BUALT_Bualt05G0040100 [Buddleja alternifolia]|uniref:Secreted protein n=1 Tax=Buddleja alternifolia TaxID=168488 RepID=A0AAV6XSJ1_9LAMI|nr:hypothetical protein BUALT_Bualt05G0040100 [Buddleja alternifolia]